MANTKPFVAVAAVCENVLREPDGVLSAIRIVDVLTLKTVEVPKPPNLPADSTPVATIQVMNLTLLVVLKAGSVTGAHRVRVVMRDPKGEVVGLPPDESPVSLKGDDGVNLVLRFGLPYNAPEGLYWFDVLWDGEVLTSAPLRLKREDVPASAG